MPVTKLTPDTPLDPPGTVSRLPAGAALDAPAAKPSDPTTQGGLFDLPHLLPESVQERLPSVLTGPTIGAQLDTAAQRREAEQKRLGRPLTLRERIDLNPIESNPVMMSFGTHQLGEAAGAGGALRPLGAAAQQAVNRARGLGADVNIGAARPAQPAQATGELLSGARAKFIGDQYTQAIRPTVANKRTAADVRKYNAQIRGGIDSIIDNKPNLQFTDAAGNVRQGELPTNLEEFADAIGQTKQTIFKKYDDMAKQTGMFGPPIDLRSVVAELNKIANDTIVTDFHPSVSRYAKQLADTLLARGSYWAEDAQRVIQNLNARLKSFYRNPSYETTGRANVDAMVANKLRETLDQTVTNTVGPGYQELKNQYGALTSFEKDVNHRAQIVARADPGGGLFGRLTDVATSAQAIHGLATLNPATFASAIATKGSAEFIKYWRSPNRAVKRLFETAEEQRQGPPQPVVPSFPLPPGLPSSERDRYVPGAPPL